MFINATEEVETFVDRLRRGCTKSKSRVRSCYQGWCPCLFLLYKMFPKETYHCSCRSVEYVHVQDNISVTIQILFSLQYHIEFNHPSHTPSPYSFAYTQMDLPDSPSSYSFSSPTNPTHVTESQTISFPQTA